MTIILRCLRCGEWALFRPDDPLGQGLCIGCFMKWMEHDVESPGGKRFLRWQKHQARHPTYKALSAALDALEATPHGSLAAPSP